MSITEEQKQERTRLAAINEVIKTIASTLDLRQVYDTFTSQLKGLIAFDRAAVALIEGDKVKRFALSVDVESEFDSGIEIPLKDTAAEWIAANKKVYIATDLAEERRFRTDDILLREGMRSVIRIPLFSRGEVIGNFTLSSCQPNAFGKKEQGVLEEVAPLLSVAIENVRFFEQTRAREEELKASEEKYRHLFEDLTDAAFLADAETGLILETNLQGEALLGKSRDEIVGMHQRQLHPADKADEYRRRFADHIEKGHAVDYDGEVIRKDGTIVPVRISASTLTIRGQHLILGLFRDITERKRADEALRESEGRLRALIENAPDAIYFNDLEAKFIDANKKAEELVGYPKEELIGKSFLEVGLLPEEYLPTAAEALEKNIKGEPIGPLELELIRKDGSRVSVELTSIPVERGGKAEVMGIARDITERKKAEEEIKRHGKRVEAHHAVTQAVSQTLDLEQLMDIALDKVLEVMDLDGGLIHLMDTEAGEMVLKAHRGVPEEFLGVMRRVEVSEAEIQRWLEYGGPAFQLESILDQATLAKMRAMTREQWPESYFVTPLFSKEILRGAMSLASRSKRRFSPEEVDLLQAIGNQIAVGIENAELFEQTEARAEALQASEAKYRRLAEDINDGYMVTKEGKVVFANAKMAEMLGYKLEELIGADDAKLIPPEAVLYAQETQQRVRQRRRVRERLEGPILNKDGERVPVEMSMKVVDYEGEPALAVIVRDITERKRAEEEHQRYTRRVEALHAIAATVSQTLDLEQMLDGALEKVKEVMEADAAMIYTVDEAARDIVLAAHKGLSDEFVASIGRIRAEEGEVERMMGWQESTIAFDKLYNEPNLTKIREAGAKEGVQSSVTVGLWSKGILLGSLTVHCRHPHECTDENLELLQAIASEIAVGMENARLFAEVSHSAITDGLTGLYNHRYFQERLDEEVARVHRFAGECSVIMLDLDHFKIYNDLFGHVAGDEVLKRLGQVLRDHTRQIDIACRYGGEEFVIILPHTGSSEAYQAAERLRQAIEQAFSQEVASTSANLTVSLGIASYPIDGLSREALIRGADFAMREAKQRGRNQTCLAFELVDAVLVEDDMERETVEHLEAASLNTIYALAAAVDARDHYTYGHSRNVSKHAVAIGKALGLSRRKLGRLRIAALLHDIGKIGLSDSIIRKPGPLDEKEWEMMRKHSELGATIISHTPELADCAPAIRHHHEWQDGSGYPDGLKGEDIPLEARIIAVADAYDTMTTPRAYRETVSPQEALKELRRCANTQFDPQLVETFTRVANSGVRAPAELSPL